MSGVRVLGAALVFVFAYMVVASVLSAREEALGRIAGDGD